MPASLKKILIVEDEKPLARALELKLSSSGFKTRIAYDGEEALRFLKKDKFNIILLDLVMPNLSGFDVLLKLNQSKNKIPVIVTSNLGQEEDFKRAKSLGVLKFFVKSDVNLSDIVKYIVDFFNNKNNKIKNNNKK